MSTNFILVERCGVAVGTNRYVAIEIGNLGALVEVSRLALPRVGLAHAVVFVLEGFTHGHVHAVAADRGDRASLGLVGIKARGP